MKINNKFKLINETREINGVTVYRIQATSDFGDVKSGDLGGWLEAERNLSPQGKAWVADNAAVYGRSKIRCSALVQDEALVYGYAEVSGGVKVSGQARVYGSARIKGRVEITDSARIYVGARVSDHAKISGSARVYGQAHISGHAEISGQARVFENAHLWGCARVTDYASVHGSVLLGDNVVVEGVAELFGDLSVRMSNDDAGPRIEGRYSYPFDVFEYSRWPDQEEHRPFSTNLVLPLLDTINIMQGPDSVNSEPGLRRAGTLSVMFMAALLGAKSIRDVWKYLLNQNAIQMNALPGKTRSSEPWHYDLATYTVLRKHVDIDVVTDHIEQWLEEQRDALPEHMAPGTPYISKALEGFRKIFFSDSI